MDDVVELAALGLASYEAALRNMESFRERQGQRAMAEVVARSFASAGVGDVAEPPARAIAVIQAGTGVGKSAAYITPGVAIAKSQGRRLVISTSTTALQEQLVAKDLPALAVAVPEPFTFAVAKGRGRYACKLKLLRHAGVASEDQDALHLDDEAVGPADAPHARVAFYRSLAESLHAGWDGDRDSLPDSPQPDDWQAIAADRHTCTARACAHYSSCSYYAARRKLAGVDVIVANHDLVLASIGARTLPELEDCYWVFDEGHHLGEKAVEQFASTMELTRLRWLDKLPAALSGVASQLQFPVSGDVGRLCRELKSTLSDVGRIIWDSFASDLKGRDPTRRLKQHEIASILGEPLRLIEGHTRDLSALASSLGEELRARMKEEPESNARWTTLYVAVGTFAPKLAETQHSAEMLLSDGDDARTTAKWCSADVTGSFVGLQLHACPILPGDLLRFHLWPRVRGAVVTSATLKGCGTWDYALSELGLSEDVAVTRTEVASPFDYARQGTLIVRKTRSLPRNLEAYNAEVCNLIAAEVEFLDKGGLALFTSRRHMEQAFEAVPEILRHRVLVQGTLSKRNLLAEHRRRILCGEPSLILG